MVDNGEEQDLRGVYDLVALQKKKISQHRAIEIKRRAKS